MVKVKFYVIEIPMSLQLMFLELGSGEVTFEWDYNGNQIPEEPFVFPTDYGYGIYIVRIFGHDPDCDATQSITITEEELICNVNIDADNQLINTLQYCENEAIPSYEITLQANFEVENASPENVTYTWFKNGEEISDATGSSYTVTYDEQGDFEDEFTVEAEIEGCIATAIISTDISLAPYEHPCKITEGISPGNNDGLNDYLDLTFLRPIGNCRIYRIQSLWFKSL